MRVIDPAPSRAGRRLSTPIGRANRIEALGLLACSVVVALGLVLGYSARMARSAQEDAAVAPIVNLHQLGAADDLLPLLATIEDQREQRRIARAVYDRAAALAASLDHVGALSSPGLEASLIRSLKPHLVVRSREEFAAAFRRDVLWFFAAFWAASLFRMWRRADDDPVLIPVLMLLCGLGFIAMVGLRDPLRDTVIASTFVAGVGLGLVALVAASEIDLESSGLRRAVIAPLGLALALAALLLVFGSGPGASGVRVNLFGFQPVEVIRLLVILSLAAYFAKRLEFLRELGGAPARSTPLLRHVRIPRWKDVRPVLVSMGLVLAFFFLQKDLGPALVLSCVFLALYGIARGRVVFVVFGLALLAAGFASAYEIGFPATVRQRVVIWLNPWNNGLPGGDQIAHGLWALSTGAMWGFGPALGDAQVIPAGHTDFILAVIGEELGFVGLVAAIALYGLLCWRCIRIALRAPGDYTAFIATAIALGLIVQACVIAAGLLGLMPLSGVVTPFLSYGRSSMVANCAAIGAVLAIARRRGAVRDHLRRPVRLAAAALATIAAVVTARVAWVQVVKADEVAVAASLSEQADGGLRFSYNPRIQSAARTIVRGSIYDRNGLPLATSRPDEIEKVASVYRQAGLVAEPCGPGLARCYPLGGAAFHAIGDWNHQTNWGAPNSSFLERDEDGRLKGYDDRPQVVDTVNPRTGVRQRTVRRDYHELLTLVRNRYRPGASAVRTLLARARDVQSSIDARLQVRTATALRTRVESAGLARGAAVVLDVDSGEVLASVSYPWPTPHDLQDGTEITDEEDGAARERLLDRARYGVYPPGSTFKVLVAGAALRAGSDDRTQTFACVRLPDGRVGNYVAGRSRPVRDDPMDTTPHGTVDLQKGLVVSCNAYFAQLAVKLGPRPLLDAASLFQIDCAKTPTAAGLQGSLAQAGYGQGQVIVSPVKMARVVASVARGGGVPAVRWQHERRASTPVVSRFLSPKDAALLSRYLREVVTSGTGRVLASNATPIAGKTGTAEVQDGPSHSWFAGFAPFGGDRHKIAFSVIVENAGYGARTAAPIAGEIVAAARGIGLLK